MTGTKELLDLLAASFRQMETERKQLVIELADREAKLKSLGESYQTASNEKQATAKNLESIKRQLDQTRKEQASSQTTITLLKRELEQARKANEALRKENDSLIDTHRKAIESLKRTDLRASA